MPRMGRAGRILVAILLVGSVAGCGSSSAPATSKSVGGVQTAGRQFLHNVSTHDYPSLSHEMSSDAAESIECTDASGNLIPFWKAKRQCQGSPTDFVLPGMTTANFAHAKIQIGGNWAYVRFGNGGWMRFVYSGGRWLFNDSLG
jgi:hypothetical protein